MKQSKLFGKTTKTVPADIKNISYKYLYQGGFIRQIVAGRYAFTPLGFKVWNKIFNLIEEEMQKIGSQRVITPTLQPIEIWQATNRDKAFGQEMLTVKDHHGSTFAIGATAEGQMVEFIKKFNPTYKDLPIIIHQFSSKFRDEKRPRGGLLRVREFMMKDAYSFCKSEEEQLEIYKKFYQAYIDIAARLDLKVIAVEADSGALGGKLCHEFMVLLKSGEDKIFICDKCNYAANIEKAEFVRENINSQEKELPLEDVYQPAEVNRIEEMSKFFKVDKNRILKNVLYKGSDDKFYNVIIRGDLNVNQSKLIKELNLEFVKLTVQEDLKKLGTNRGLVPVMGLKNVIYIGDISLKTVKNFIGGNKREKQELEWKNSNLDRDFKVGQLIDVAEAKNGDRCVKCEKGILKEKRALEFGHIFKQDLFYTEPQKGYFTHKDGKEKPMWMGAYGIGIERAMAIVVETHSDEKGIIWPENLAPFNVHLINLRKNTDQSDKLYQKLMQQNVDVLYDDRIEVSAGEKLKDADLIGIPIRLIISDKTKDRVEYKRRDKKEIKLLDEEELFKMFSLG